MALDADGDGVEAADEQVVGAVVVGVVDIVDWSGESVEDIVCRD